jgi:DNA-binding transcriptional MocR family regulator
MNGAEPRLPFVPAWLDDARVSPSEFRILAHLWRRGKCHSTAETIAQKCQVNRKTVFAVLKSLESAGFIRRTARCGRTTLIEPIPLGATGYPVPQLGRVEEDPVSELGRVEGDPVSDLERPPVSQPERPPSQLRHREGSPLKVPQGKDQEGGQSEIVKPLCSLAQAHSFAPTLGMNPAETEHWWHTRNAGGWTKGTAGSAPPRKIQSWQSDMNASVGWVREALAKQGIHSTSNGGKTVNSGGRTFKVS